MKKIVAVFLMLFMLVSLCACGNDTADTSTDSAASSADAVSTENSSVESDTAASEEVSGGYVVTVVDSDNNPIPNAILQLCKLGDDGSCTPGSPSDAEGKVTFSLPEDSYKVSFIVMPTGYTYAGEEQEFYFEEGAKELTITLAKAD